MENIEARFFVDQVKRSYEFLLEKGFSFENQMIKPTFYSIDIVGKNIKIEYSFDIPNQVMDVYIYNLNFNKNMYDFKEGALLEYLISIKKLRGEFSDGNTSNSKDYKNIVSSKLKNDIRLFKEFAKELIEDKADAFKIVNR